MEQCYVYVWYDSQSGNPIYVGAGKQYRYKYKTSHRSQQFIQYVKNHQCYVQKIVQNLSIQQSRIIQIQTIKKFKEEGHVLFNKTIGGQSGGYQNKRSEEQKLHLSEMNRGQNNPNYKNKWSQKQKDDLSKLKKQNHLHSGTNNGRCVPVKCVQTGKHYDYLTQASDQLGLRSSASITKCLDKPNRTAKGFHFVRD